MKTHDQLIEGLLRRPGVKSELQRIKMEDVNPKSSSVDTRDAIAELESGKGKRVKNVEMLIDDLNGRS